MKRFLPFTLMLMLLFTCYGNALAVETGVLSSSVMSQYSAVMFQGSARGVVEISYAVSGTAPTMTSIGVSSKRFIHLTVTVSKLSQALPPMD